jgi:hypothetical protein
VNILKVLLGVLLILAGIAAGLYVGLYLCFYGGIVLVIHGFQAHPAAAGKIAFGILRFVLTSVAGWLSFFLLAGPGIALVTAGVD